MSRTPLVALALSGLLTLSGGLVYGMSGTAAAKSQPTVSIATVRGLGKVLVDSKNHTLYSHVKNHRPVACTGACLGTFVPLTVEAGAKPTAGKGVSGLGVVNGNQVTEHSFPLFLFSGDQARQAKGAGKTSSGGTWQVVKVTGGKSKKGGGSNAGTGGVSF